MTLGTPHVPKGFSGFRGASNAVFSVHIQLDKAPAHKLTKLLRHLQCTWLQQSSQEMDSGVQGHGLCCWSIEAFV